MDVPLHAVINELSWARKINSDKEAIELVKEIVNNVKGVRSHFKKFTVSNHEKLPETEIESDNQAVSCLLSDELRDEWLYLLTVGDRASSQPNIFEDVQYYYNENESVGLGLAHENGCLSLSSSMIPDFRLREVTISKYEIVEKADDVIESKVIVDNFWDSSSRTMNWLEKEYLSVFHDPALLVSEIENLFPGLRFLPESLDQIQGLEHVHFSSVVGRLFELNEASQEWDPKNGLPKWRSHVTPEHSGRKRLCCFVDDIDGEEKCFDLHARYTPGPGRIHLLLDPKETRKVVVGYIGRKIEN